MQVTIRKFEKMDIPNKVKWINDTRNNTYLHYDLPLEVEKTERWYELNKDRVDRYDATILCDGAPVGLIGLLSISDGTAEYYVSMGEQAYKGKGIAKEASRLLLEYAQHELNLISVYLYTEIDNIAAQKLFEKIGFEKKYVEEKSANNRGKLVDRYFYEYVF